MAKKQFGDYDSDEERYFEWYLEELYDVGIIKKFLYQPDPFKLSNKITYNKETQLKTKVKVEEREFLRSHEYTPDFKVLWSRSGLNTLFNIIGERVKIKCPFWGHMDSGEIISYIDVKGGFAPAGNSSAITFPLNQKWIYDKYKIYIQKVVVSNKKGSIFRESFTPTQYLITEKSLKPRIIHYKPVLTLKEYLENGRK